MSFDLVFWRGGEKRDPTEIWDELNDGDALPDGLVPINLGRTLAVLRGFPCRESAYEEGLIVVEGHEWETAFDDSDTVSHFVISWSWSVVEDSDLEAVQSDLVSALEAVGLSCFDPQTGDWWDDD